MSQAQRIQKAQIKAEREAREWERVKFLADKVLTPDVVRLGLLAGIITFSTMAARSRENVGPVQSALAFALPGIGIPMIAANAGIRDKYALAAISAASTAYVTGQTVAGWQMAGVPAAGGIIGAIGEALLNE